MKPRAGSRSVCRIGSPRVKRRSCTAPGRPEVEIFMKCEKQGALLPGEPPVRSSMPKGWEARPTPTGPSDHHLRAPGHLAPDPANKRSLPPNGSKAWVQGPHRSCLLASLRATPGPTRGPREIETLPHEPLASQSPLGSHSRSRCYR